MRFNTLGQWLAEIVEPQPAARTFQNRREQEPLEDAQRMFRKLAQLVRRGHPVNMIAAAPNAPAMPAEHDNIGRPDPTMQGERLSPASVAAVSCGIDQPLQPGPVEPRRMVSTHAFHVCTVF